MEKKHATESQELEPEPASTRSGKIRKPVLPDLEAEEQPSTRSGRIRKHSFTIQPEVSQVGFVREIYCFVCPGHLIYCKAFTCTDERIDFIKINKNHALKRTLL